MAKIQKIKETGSGDNPQTEEGKIILLMHHLNKFIETNKEIPICNIYLKIKKEGYIIPSEYKTILDKMEEVVNRNDLIKLQFTKFSDSMPPLNITGFKKFDPWQLDVINNINKGISTIISAPTSAGKTVLAGYATTKGRTLVVMPTDALCWQMASYIGGFLNKDIPILTDTFNSIQKDNCPCLEKKNSLLGLSCSFCSMSTRDKIIKNLNNSVAIVGTPDAILNFLPLMNTDFNWIIMDEIHMIGKMEGSPMEPIAKVFNNTNFLALSATIGNMNEVNMWFKKLNPNRQVENIICDKRFFNLQKYYYNPKNDELNILHPMALVNFEDFENGSILTKNLSATPVDIWLLYSKLKEEFGDLDKLNHEKYFGLLEIIHLDKVNKYLIDLIQFMVKTVEKEKIRKIIDSFKKVELYDDPVDLVKLAFNLKESEKVPAIIFQKNTSACIKMIMDFGTKIEELENAEFPDLYNTRVSDRVKGEKLSLALADLEATELSRQKKEKKNGNKIENLPNKEIMQLENEIGLLDLANPYEPHYKYILNPTQVFKEEKIIEIINELKCWFSNEKGGKPHFIINLLWRGIGIYAKGLPESYLRLIQRLTCEKKIAILFSDMSLVFGVSMPFRTAVIYNNPNLVDDLDSMIYHQMAGRAGRRGLDKEGNVIFAGYKWERIKELSTCSIPNIEGINILNYTGPHANMISKLEKKKLNWETIYENNLLDQKTIKLEELNSNYANKWSFALSKDINHLWMMWTLRNTGQEPLIISYLLPLIINKYENINDNNQTSLFYLLANFLDCIIDENDEEIQKIKSELNNLEIATPTIIDDKLWLSFKMKKIIFDDIRNRLLNLTQKMIAIQIYFYHINSINLTLLFGKLIHSIFNIYHNNSYLIKREEDIIVQKNNLQLNQASFTLNQPFFTLNQPSFTLNQPSFAYYYNLNEIKGNTLTSINCNDDEE